MAVENHGMTRLPARKLYFTPGADEEIALSGNAVLSQLRQCDTPATEALARSAREHLDRVLRSEHFDGSTRSREFLRYVVEEVLAGRAGYLKQASIAVEVFGRKPDFDAVIDPIVRVQAGRLRRSLERYYLLSGDADSMRIELPKGSYAPVFVDTAVARAPQDLPSESARDWPTLVAFPFSVQTARDSAAAAALVDELTAELCRYGLVHVLRPADAGAGSQSLLNAARFELHGVVRDTGSEPLFSARLIDKSTGQQVWADEFHTREHPERWSGNAGEIGRVIAARVGAEHGVIARLLAGGHAARGFQPGDSYSAIARCQHFLFSRQPGALLPAIEALQQLTSRAPEIELAWTSLARLYLMNHTFELSGMFTPAELAIGCANQSVLLEPASARTRCLTATTLLVKGELGAARRELELALRFNNDSFAYREVIGWLMSLTGDWDAGVALMRSARERNPYCHPCVSHGLWADAMRRGDFDAAYAAALEYRDPNFFWRELMLTSSLGQLDRPEDAHASAAELLRVKPSFLHRGRHLLAHYLKTDELRAIVLDGLRKAGLQIV